MVKITSRINKDVLHINKKTQKLKKSSIFEIVINTNKSYARDYTGAMKPIEAMFIECCKYLFAKKRIMSLIMCVCASCKNGGEPRCDLSAKVLDIDNTVSVEAGSRRKFLHANITLNVIHDTRIHVNIKRIREVSNLFMGKVIAHPNIFVGVKCLSANLYNSKQYVSHAPVYIPI